MVIVARFWKAALALPVIVNCHSTFSQSPRLNVDANSGDNGAPTVKAIQSAPSKGVIPAERNFAWNPGLTSKGGVPYRTTICAMLSPGANIQAALKQLSGRTSRQAEFRYVHR